MEKSQESLKEVQDKLEPAIIKNRTDRILYPKEHVLKQAMASKLFIVDDTLLDKPETDYSHFEFMMQSILPSTWEGCATYLDVLKVFWSELDPYLKKLVVNYEVANAGIHAVEADLNILIKKNVDMIEFLKLEGLFETFKDFEKHQKEKEESTGESI